MADSNVQISLELVTQAFKNALKDAEKTTDNFQKNVSSNFGSIGSSFSVMAGSLAATGISKALGLITDGIGNMVSEAVEAEESANNLSTALKQSGQYTDEARDSMLDFATALSKVSTYDDDLIVQSQNLLLTLTDLSTNGVNQATKASTDLAAALGIDLTTATEMVSKAINGNTSAFSKLGIEIKKGKTDSENLANTLQALEKYQGSAEAKTKTFSGAMAQLSNSWGNFLGQVGAVGTTSGVTIGILNGLSKVISTIGEVLSGNNKNFNEFIESLKISGSIVAGAAIAYGTLTAAIWAINTANISQVAGWVAVKVEAAAAWAAALAPYTLVVAAVGAVVAGVYLLYKNWEDVKIATATALASTLEFSAKSAEAIGINSKALREAADEARIYAAQVQAGVDQKKLDEANEVKSAEAKKQRAEEEAKINEAKKVHLEELKAKQEALTKANNDFTDSLAKKNEDTVAQQGIELENLKLFYEQKDALEAYSDVINYENKLARQQEYLAKQNAILEANYANDKARILKSTQDEQTKRQAIDQLDKQFQQSLLKNQVDFDKQKATIDKARKDQEDKDRNYKLSATSELFGSLGSLLMGASKANFNTAKNFMLAEATISGYLAIQKALASGPYPFNLAMAAAVGIQTAANVSRISSQQPPAFASGGIVPGSNTSGDSVMARLNSGEMVLNKSSQAKLFSQINNPGSVSSDNSETNALLGAILTVLKQPMSAEVDNRGFINMIRDELAGGRSF